jgi:phage protein D
MSLLGNILGVRLQLMIGKSPVALPAPRDALLAIEEIEVKLSDTEESGFKIVIKTGRSSPLDFLEAPFVADDRFDVGSRVIVTMIFDVTPQVIFDGLVTKRNYSPTSGRLTLLGRDLSHELDKEVKQKEHMAMDETTIATMIALSYPQFGMIPMVLPPKVIDPPIPIDRVPQQRCSDWAYLRHMARRHGYDTYVDPGPVPGVNTLYWGPQVKPGVPQRTITVDSGPLSDAYNLTTSHDGEELTVVEAKVLDRFTGQETPVMALINSQTPMGAVPDLATRSGETRKKPLVTSGLTMAQAMARAQAETDNSARSVFTVSGTLDTTRYNGALKAREQVFLRGAGTMQDGTYKVSEVRHRIKPGGYLQEFVLSRSEKGPMAPVVMP